MASQAASLGPALARPSSCRASQRRLAPDAAAEHRLFTTGAADARRGRLTIAAAQRRRLTVAAAERGGGGAVLDRPGYQTIGPGSGPSADSAGSKLDSNGGRGLGGGAWRVLLIDSDKHTEERVVLAITTVVPGADESHAANCYHTARSLGMAIITSSPKEHAEFFCQQLWQRGCRVSMEPDTTTL